MSSRCSRRRTARANSGPRFSCSLPTSRAGWLITFPKPDSAKTGILTLSLDEAQFQRDWQSSNVAEAVQQDIRDGQTLGVRATPEFFVNGKPMPSFGYQQLKDLVEEAIAEAY